MSLILQVTKAGREQKANCRLNNLPLPRFAAFVIDSAATQNNDAPVIQTLYESQQTDIFVVKQIDDVAFGIESLIPPTSPAGWVRGIGLKTTDGIVYAYARYAEANGGIYKPAGLGIELKLVLAEDGRASIEFTYSVIDVAEIKRKLLSDIWAELNIDGIVAMIEQAKKVCLIDGNDTAYGIDGGNPEPACQIIPIDQQLNAVDGGTL